jgi:hypothetical protein
MRNIILLIALIITFGCKEKNEYGIVKIDDNKTQIIKNIFENVSKEDNSYLKSVFDDSMIMVNALNDTLNREDFFKGIENMYQNFDEITFDQVNGDADGSEIETNYYSNGLIWTAIWSTFKAKGNYTGKEVSFPFHISYQWKGDKIIKEVQFADMTVF